MACVFFNFFFNAGINHPTALYAPKTFMGMYIGNLARLRRQQVFDLGGMREQIRKEMREDIR